MVTVNRGLIACDDARASPRRRAQHAGLTFAGQRFQRSVRGLPCRGSLRDCADRDVDGAPGGGLGGRDEVLK
jgi:hypothetical protein